MLFDLYNEFQLIKSFLNFSVCPKYILKIDSFFKYLCRLIIHLALFMLIVTVYTIPYKKNLQKYSHYHIMIIFTIFRSTLDYTTKSIYCYYIKDQENPYLICIISLYTNIYLLILTIFFMFFPRLPWLFAFSYGILGNKTYRRKFEFVLEMIVDYDINIKKHYGNIVGCVYMLWALIWFVGMQCIIVKLDKRQKQQIYVYIRR